jgi:hypothetical protein
MATISMLFGRFLTIRLLLLLISCIPTPVIITGAEVAGQPIESIMVTVYVPFCVAVYD